MPVSNQQHPACKAGKRWAKGLQELGFLILPSRVSGIFSGESLWQAAACSRSFESLPIRPHPPSPEPKAASLTSRSAPVAWVAAVGLMGIGSTRSSELAIHVQTQSQSVDQIKAKARHVEFCPEAAMKPLSRTNATKGVQ